MILRTLILLFLILCSSCVFAPSRKEFAQVYFNLGNAYLKLGEAESAARAFLKAAEYDSGFASATFNLAKSYMLAGRYGNALEIIESLLEEEEDNATLRSVQAYCYYKIDNSEKAMEIYRSILERNPADFDASFNYAVLLAEEGQDEEALRLLLELEKLDTKNSALYFEIAKTAFNSGDMAKAAMYGEKALELEDEEIEISDFLLLAYEKGGFYAKYLEMADDVIEYNTENNRTGSTAGILFRKSVIYLTYTGEGDAGAEALEQALKEGFKDKEELYDLYTNRELLNISDIREIIDESGLIKGYNPEADSDDEKGDGESNSSGESSESTASSAE